MGKFEHKPFTETMYLAKHDDGDLVEVNDEHMFTFHPQTIIDWVGDMHDTGDDVTLYKAQIEWVPITRVMSTFSGAEPVSLTETTSKVERLQSAVREMLYELNIYQEQESIGSVREVALDTIETYGLTQEDME